MHSISNNFDVFHFHLYEGEISIELLMSDDKKEHNWKEIWHCIVYSVYQYIVSSRLRLISLCLFSIYIWSACVCLAYPSMILWCPVRLQISWFERIVFFTKPGTQHMSIPQDFTGGSYFMSVNLCAATFRIHLFQSPQRWCSCIVYLLLFI
jgi:hypothetical protein